VVDDFLLQHVRRRQVVEIVQAVVFQSTSASRVDQARDSSKLTRYPIAR
jgi:hypothetical protein